jgi:small subunit ribosomal protein S11
MSEDPKSNNDSPQEESSAEDAESSPVEEIEGQDTPLAGPEKAPEVEAESEPEKEPEVEAKEEAPAEPASKADPEPEPEAEAKPEPKAESKPESKAKAKPEPEVEAKPEPETESKPEPKPKAKAKKSTTKIEKTGGDEKEGGSSKEGEGTEDKESQPKAPSAQDLLKEDIGEIKVRRAKGSKNVHSGVVSILATFNNTKVTFADKSGNVISWSSAGKCGFRGSRKSTAYAAQVVTQDAGRKAMGHGLKEVEVRVKGPGMGRDSAIRALQALGLNVMSIIDVTPIPHNGCRPPKRRRV